MPSTEKTTDTKDEHVVGDAESEQRQAANGGTPPSASVDRQVLFPITFGSGPNAYQASLGSLLSAVFGRTRASPRPRRTAWRSVGRAILVASLLEWTVQLHRVFGVSLGWPYSFWHRLMQALLAIAGIMAISEAVQQPQAFRGGIGQFLFSLPFTLLFIACRAIWSTGSLLFKSLKTAAISPKWLATSFRGWVTCLVLTLTDSIFVAQAKGYFAAVFLTLVLFALLLRLLASLFYLAMRPFSHLEGLFGVLHRVALWCEQEADKAGRRTVVSGTGEGQGRDSTSSFLHGLAVLCAVGLQRLRKSAKGSLESFRYLSIFLSELVLTFFGFALGFTSIYVRLPALSSTLGTAVGPSFWQCFAVSVGALANLALPQVFAHASAVTALVLAEALAGLSILAIVFLAFATAARGSSEQFLSRADALLEQLPGKVKDDLEKSVIK